MDTTPADDAKPVPLSAVEIRSVDFEGPIKGADFADASLLGDRYRAAYTELENKSTVEARTFALLQAICSFHFKPEDKAAPFGPMMQWDGKRSAVPEDFRGPQADALAAIAPEIQHPGLRARLADTAWINDRRNGQIAACAVDAYAECLDKLLDGNLSARFSRDEGTPHEALNIAKRAVQIAAAIKRRSDPLTGPAAVAVLALRDAARDRKEASLFQRASTLAWHHGLVDSEKFATELEGLLASEPDPMGRQAIWRQAANCYADLDREADKLRCLEAAAEEYVVMADAMSGSPMAAASWLADAIKSLRPLKGTKARRKELEARLLITQENISDEMATFSSGPVDLSDIAQGTIDVFEGLSLGTALGQLAMLTRSPVLETRRSEALDSLKASPLAAVFGMTKVDRDGKTIAVVPGAETGGEPNEEWLLHKYAESDGLRRRIFVAGQLEPVRRHLSSRVSITERHFRAIVQNSPFVPLGYESIFALGFARMIQGDAISAAHILLPQMENSLRDVLTKSGTDASIIQADMSQEDRSISSMLENSRAKLEEIFGADLILEIDLLYNSRLGPALRHDMAHGKINTNECFDSDVRYACWLVFRITCLPLLGVWAEIVTAIESEEF